MQKIQLDTPLVRAGAGTGKTKYLVDEVYRLFKEYRKLKAKNPRLIVCTFTRKASQELKERLFKMAVKELEQQTLKGGKQSFQQGKNKRKENQVLFLNYIQSPSLYISTIDGILNMFLKRYGHKFGLSPDFQLSYGRTNETLFDSLAEEFIFEKNFSLLKKIPYFFLRELFIFYFKCRLKYGKVSFYNEKDFEEFNRDRQLFLEIENLFGKGNHRPDRIKIKQHFEKHNSLLASIFNWNQDIDEIKKLFKEEDSFQVDQFVPLFEEFHRAGEEFFLKFMEKKKNGALLNIEDLLLFSLALLKENPETAQSFSKEWDFWLIDEYQDTSWVQEQIIEQITGFKNVFCVGDPAQSIYLFRGSDPHIFKRREKDSTGRVKKLEVNRRSSASLIYFFNDFFLEDRGFMKFKPYKNKLFDSDKPCVYFLTYEKPAKQKNEYKLEALTALYHYIQRLKREGFHYSDMAVLSSRNDDLAEIASHLRSCNLPLMLYSSNNFSQNRLVLDALFLLKFLINPYDNTNLKALLRTPYFRLSDQELADSSCDHFELGNNGKSCSFWSFIQDKFFDRLFIKSLSLYLLDKKEYGLVKSFERALIDSGLMELSHFQDPTGASSANLWKLLYLLNKDSSSPLELFYSLLTEEEEADRNKEAPVGDSDAIQLMTIHKSKGLEFKHVIVMDFSIADSSLKSGNSTKDSVILDDTGIRQKIAFAVPMGGRDNPKVKCYAHKIYNKKQGWEKLLEKERLFYVAMTRAEHSLTLFIPNSVPQRNSWLDSIQFFKEFSAPDEALPLLAVQYDKKDQTKLKSWRLNEGQYNTKHYFFCVQSSESICQSPDQWIHDGNELKKSFPKKHIGWKEQNFTSAESEYFKNESNDKSEIKNSGMAEKLQEDYKIPLKKIKDVSHNQKGEIVVVTGGEEYFKKDCGLKVKSFKHFLKETMEKEQAPGKRAKKYKSSHFTKDQQWNVSDKIITSLEKTEISNAKSENYLRGSLLSEEAKASFHFFKAKNLLFKTNLGNHLHFFLQKLSYRTFEQIQPLVEILFLSKEEQKQIKQALTYITELKEPPMKLFLKTGFSEWPFKMRKGKVFLQGQIDLWALDKKHIHLFDYKSSESQSSRTKKQLIFYSGILNELYHPEKIWMYEVYPFQKMLRKSLYNQSHKSLFKGWIDGIN